jgi:hypothetical protein
MIPTIDEVKQSRDPAWLRTQADMIEKEGRDIAATLRQRADYVEVNNNISEKIKEHEAIVDFMEENDISILKEV